VAHIWRWKYSLGFSLLVKPGGDAPAIEGAVPALQIIGQPADVVLGRDDQQLPEAVEDAGEDQHAERLLDLVRQYVERVHREPLRGGDHDSIDPQIRVG